MKITMMTKKTVKMKMTQRRMWRRRGREKVGGRPAKKRVSTWTHFEWGPHDTNDKDYDEDKDDMVIVMMMVRMMRRRRMKRNMIMIGF